MLEDHPDFASRSSEVRLGQGGEFAAGDEDLVRIGAFQQVNAANQGAFAGTRGADDAKDPAGLDRQIDVGQDGGGAGGRGEDFGEAHQMDYGVGDRRQLPHGGSSSGRVGRGG